MYKEAPKKLAISYSHSGPSPSVGTKSTYLNAWLYNPNPTHSDSIGQIPTVFFFCPPVSLFRCPFPYPRSLSHPPFSPFPRRLWGSWSWCLYPTCWCLAGLLTVVCLPTMPTPSYILLRNPKREQYTLWILCDVQYYFSSTDVASSFDHPVVAGNVKLLLYSMFKKAFKVGHIHLKMSDLICCNQIFL